jgi:hypothetical protein
MAAFAIVPASPLAAKGIRAGNIVITDPVLRDASPQVPPGAGVLMIGNSGKQADRLQSAASDLAAVTRMHATIRVGVAVPRRGRGADTEDRRVPCGCEVQRGAACIWGQHARPACPRCS